MQAKYGDLKGAIDEYRSAHIPGAVYIDWTRDIVDPDDPENFRRALKPNTKAIFSETLGNPAINVIDLAAVAAIAREAGVPFIVPESVLPAFSAAIAAFLPLGVGVIFTCSG